MAINQNKLKKYRTELEKLQANSKGVQTLKKLFKLNQNNPNRINNNLIKLVADVELLQSAYNKLKSNKGSMTKGTDDSTPDGVTNQDLKKLSENLKNGTFKWSAIRREMIPKLGRKEKRSLGIPNFKDRIVQENIRIILQSIYEPLFQIEEANHGFRPKRGIETAMIQLQRTSKEMNWALEGDIEKAFQSLIHSKLMKILGEKISDKKFLKLVYEGLRHNIVFGGRTDKNLLGTPQGGIASPILFNIYMRKFDLYINELIIEYLKINIIEKRKTNEMVTKTTRKLRNRVQAAKYRIEKFKTISRPLLLEEKLNIRKDAEIMRKSKSELLRTRSGRDCKRIIRFAYIRYADDWILLTNAKRDIVLEIKEKCSKWLIEELRLQLAQDKTQITNLDKEKAKFLGFTIFRKKKRIIKKTSKKGIIFRQRSTVELTLGIDHDRVRNRLIAGKILNEKLEPRSNTLYGLMKPVYIVRKYRQRLEGLINYYYHLLTYPTELNLYYYGYKFSCLKTLARRMNKSIKKITLIYGEEMNMKIEIKESTLKGEIIRIKQEKFPTYRAAMNKGKEMKNTKNAEIYNRLALQKKLKSKETEKKNFLPSIEIEDCLKNLIVTADPFSMHDIAVNLRSGYQMASHCCICGEPNSEHSPIEMHHVNQIKKGKVSGFSQLLKNLNRTTIPVCRPCHQKIHKGIYDGYKLRDLFDIEITQI